MLNLKTYGPPWSKRIHRTADGNIELYFAKLYLINLVNRHYVHG